LPPIGIVVLPTPRVVNPELGRPGLSIAGGEGFTGLGLEFGGGCLEVDEAQDAVEGSSERFEMFVEGSDMDGFDRCSDCVWAYFL
jgi:hypothetical protein